MVHLLTGVFTVPSLLDLILPPSPHINFFFQLHLLLRLLLLVSSIIYQAVLSSGSLSGV